MASWIILSSSIVLILMIFIRISVCKMEAQCPKYWVHRTGSNECYLMHTYGHSRSRDDSKDYCKKNGGNLVYIIDQETKDWLSVHIADSGLVGENAQIWVNAQMQDDHTWIWPEVGKAVDNSLLPWQVEGEDTDSKCAVYTEDQKLLKKGCNKQMRFICHRDITTPMMCDMENDWVDQNNRCYKVANDKQSWHDAAVSCEMDDGGWLMVVNGDYESYYIYDESVRIRDNIWIGLTEEGNAGHWNWYTGDNSTYRHWNVDKGEPITRNGFGSAIVDHNDADGAGRWYNEDIKAHHRYICEKNQGSCLSGWQSYKNTCYFFNSLGSDNSVFETANITCNSVGGHLAIINDALENAYIFETMAGDDQLWIGLYTIPHEKFMWVNGKSMNEVNFTLLSDSEVDNTLTTEEDRKCVYIKYIKDENNNDAPKWVIDDCTQQKHFLCEIGSGTAITIPPPSSDIYCPEGWSNWADHCYKFVADELPWTSAQTECKKVQGADLASITSWPENDIITDNFIALSWIGLNDRAQDGSYRWSDGSHVNIKNWAENEPSEGDENCVQMYEGGKWNDLRCDNKRPYVCKMVAADHPVDPIETTTPNTTPDSYACGWDWVENPVSGECYRIETEKLTWYDARSHCRYLGDDYHGHDQDIDLVSLTTTQEQEFVYSLLKDAKVNSPDVWTGLQADYDGMHWTDETPLHFFNFQDAEPNSYGTEPCIEMYMDSGYWNDQDCNKRSAFVCEKKGENYVGPIDPPVPDVRCPKGWNFFNDYCYLQELVDTANWEDAHSFCKDQYGGELTSITSQEENDFILGIIQMNYVNTWLGLHDDNNGSNWHWTDGNNLDLYINWMDGEPNNVGGGEHCGEMTSDSYAVNPGAWNDCSCNDVMSFICKISVSACPLGWQFNEDGCYYLSNLEKTWSAARQSCKEINENSDLVSVHNDAENSFFSSMLNVVSESAWLGYKYRNASDKWKWSDGSSSDYENWNTGEPNQNDTEWCSESINWQGSDTHGKWNNLACSENRFYGCELNGANITHTVGCEQDWRYFNNYCYYYSDINYDTWGLTYSEAGADCQRKGGSIASIHSIEENDFVYSMSGSAVYYETSWVGLSAEGHGDLLWPDNTDITYTNWALLDSTVFWSTNLCAVYDANLFTGEWNLGDCEVPSYYICKKPAETVPINPPIPTGCKENDVSYKGSCYNFQDEENTWQAAEDDCISDYNGHTVVINDQFENAFISSYLKGTGSHWWTGLKGTAADDGSVTFTWVNGDSLDFANWEEYEPAPNHGLCVAASGHDTLPGFWMVSSCDEARHYICEYDNNDYVPPTPPSTPPPPPPNCATNWTHNQDEQRCYKVFSSPNTWGRAENHCTRLGGHLTSVGSAEEQTFIKTLPGMTDLDVNFPKIWIGLHQGSESGYEWTDGTPEGYVDWDDGQPDSDDHREDCVAAKKESFKESDDVCDSFYPYICEAEQGMTLTTLSPPTEGPVSYCDEDPDWLLYDDHCYKIVSASDEQNSFWTSQKRCQDDGAELVSIHSAEENAFINSRIYSLSDNALWLGGLASLDGGFHWSDNSSFAYFNWAKGEPNNWHDQESCVSIYTNHDNGYWNDVNCAALQGRICKRPNGKTLPPPVTFPPPNGHCPVGWIHIGSRCIQLLSGDNTTIWDKARQKCKDLGDGIDLISVHSEEDQAAVTALVGRSGRSAWLGFYNNGGFHWSDQSEADYTNWASGEPNGNSQDATEDCAMAYYWNGQWNDAPCDLTADYICQRGLDSGIATHKPPPACNGEFSSYFNYSGACYKAVNDLKTWQDAESSCASEGAHLASVETIAENSYIYLLGKEAGTGVNNEWIGFNSLQDTNDNRHFEWSDGWPVLFSNWGPGSPNASLTDHRCTHIDGSDGLWYTSKCNIMRPFLCKYSENTIPTPDPPSTGYCPDNRWQNLGGGYCYLVNTDAHTWSDANQACISEGVKESPSFLVSIHSGAEKDLILKISNSILSPMWIGLIQQQSDFGWSDGTALDFINWDDGEPNSEDERCGTVKSHSGSWNDMACNNELPYICKMKKIQTSEPTNPPVTPPPVTPPPKPKTTVGPGEYTSPGLSAGGIVGIVIAVLFVVAFVGVLGYQHHTKPKSTVAFSNPAFGKNSTQSSSKEEPVVIGSNFGVTDA